MTGDERDRILGLLSAGPATVGRLAAGLGLPGGVVSYQLTLLEREGLVRVGSTRVERGVPTPVWVSTAAAAPPPLPIPAPLPGLTWTGDGPYPAPVWTAPHPTAPAPTDAGSTAETVGRRSEQAADPRADRHAGDAAPAEEGWPTGEGWPARERSATGERPMTGERPTAWEGPSDAQEWPPGAGWRGDRHRPGPEGAPADRQPGRRGTRPGAGPPPSGPGGSAAEGRQVDPRDETRSGEAHPTPPAPEGRPAWPATARPPLPRRPDQADAGSGPGPRLFDIRRIPVDDATFYEFASRLDALAREFASRATPGAPATELTVGLTRPAREATYGYGS